MASIRIARFNTEKEIFPTKRISVPRFLTVIFVLTIRVIHGFVFLKEACCFLLEVRTEPSLYIYIYIYILLIMYMNFILHNNSRTDCQFKSDFDI